MSPGVTFITHDEPARRPSESYIAMVDLAPFGFPGQMEQIWLRSLGGNEYENCCLPFRVYGLAFGDVVSLDADGKKVVAVIRCSGARVFRIFFPQALPDGGFVRMKDRVSREIGRSGLLAEWSGQRHIAIHIAPDEGPLDALWHIVRDIAGEGAVWEWGDVEDFRSS